MLPYSYSSCWNLILNCPRIASHWNYIIKLVLDLFPYSAVVSAFICRWLFSALYWLHSPLFNNERTNKGNQSTIIGGVNRKGTQCHIYVFSERRKQSIGHRSHSNCCCNYIMTVFIGNGRWYIVFHTFNDKPIMFSKCVTWVTFHCNPLLNVISQ